MSTDNSLSLVQIDDASLAQLERLSNEVRRLRRINEALIGQVERSMDVQGNAFSMFRTSIALETKVRERTVELRQLNNELAHATTAMSQFIAAASHDLLQPLNAARVFVSALAEQELNAKNRSLVDNACNAMDATEELLSTILDMSRIDAGVIPVENTDFSVAPLMEALCTEMAPVAEANSLSLRAVSCGAVGHSDPKLVTRILRNFLTNAIRYTEHGGILIGCRRFGENIRIGVWDTGVGIPEDKLSLIYREFQRLPNEKSEIASGMGLGLAIVERIAKQLGINILTQSHVGRGSYFGIEIPRGKKRCATPSSIQPPATGNTQPLAQTRLLFIDNEESILKAMTALLTSWRCDVRVAQNMEAAISVADSPPDVILADYHLDNNEIGLDTVLKLRQRWQADIPFVIITADYERAVADKVAAVGGHILHKPVKPAKLRSLLSFLRS